MRAVRVTQPGGSENLTIVDVPRPELGSADVLIEAAAAGVNRADLLQREGFYPPPPGASDILGLEVSGVVREIGSAVTTVNVGDEVVALLAGGGYAEFVAVDASQTLPLPPSVSLEHGAALPEAFATVWSNLFMVAGLQPDEWILIHGGGSGIGTIAIQLAVSAGARVITTVGSDHKAAAAAALGAEFVINYRQQSFADEVQNLTQGHGVDVILDIIGAKYLEPNLRSLAVDGRLVIIGLQGGAKADLDLGSLLSRRLSVVGTSLRSRPIADKAMIMAQLREVVWPMLGQGSLQPVVSEVYDLADVVAAHDALAAGDHFGKVLLRVAP